MRKGHMNRPRPTLVLLIFLHLTSQVAQAHSPCNYPNSNTKDSALMQ